jgi:hypothetical protein
VITVVLAASEPDCQFVDDRNCILNFLGLHHLLAGELAAAERLIDEDRLIADATGNLPVTYAAMLAGP